jgi:ABC-type nitrate/sulfonate/bicarbonate transport system substrate-binding protein
MSARVIAHGRVREGYYLQGWRGNHEILQRGALLVGLLVVMPVRGAASERTLIRFSFSSGWDALPAVVALERGFFAQEGLIVSGLAASSAQAVINSLAAGSTDFATIPQQTLLVMAALKLPVQVISMNGWGTEMEIVVPKENTTVKSLADLKDKTIAVGIASETYPVLIRLLNKSKMRPTDVTIKPLPASDLTQTLRNKLVDAVFETQHFTTVLVKTGQGRLVLAHKDIVKALGLIGAAPLVTRKAQIDKERLTATRSLRAMLSPAKNSTVVPGSILPKSPPTSRFRLRK